MRHTLSAILLSNVNRLSVVAIALFSLTAGGEPSNSPASQINLLQTSQSVVVGFQDFDLVRRRLPNLRGAVTFLDPAGEPIDTFVVNFADEVTQSHTVFSKVASKR